MLLVGAGDLPANKLRDVDLGTLAKVVGCNSNVRAKGAAVGYKQRW